MADMKRIYDDFKFNNLYLEINQILSYFCYNFVHFMFQSTDGQISHDKND